MAQIAYMTSHIPASAASAALIVEEKTVKSKTNGMENEIIRFLRNDFITPPISLYWLFISGADK